MHARMRGYIMVCVLVWPLFQCMYMYACTYMPTCVCIQEGSGYGPTGQGVANDFVYVLHPCRNTDIPADIHVYRHTFIRACMHTYKHAILVVYSLSVRRSVGLDA